MAAKDAPLFNACSTSSGVNIEPATIIGTFPFTYLLINSRYVFSSLLSIGFDESALVNEMWI